MCVCESGRACKCANKSAILQPGELRADAEVKNVNNTNHNRSAPSWTEVVYSLSSERNHQVKPRILIIRRLVCEAICGADALI